MKGHYGYMYHPGYDQMHPKEHIREHIHEFVGETEITEDHRHKYAGTTEPAPNGVQHTHKY